MKKHVKTKIKTKKPNRIIGLIRENWQIVLVILFVLFIYYLIAIKP